MARRLPAAWQRPARAGGRVRNAPLRQADTLVGDNDPGLGPDGHGSAKLAKDKENKALISAGVGLSALLKNYSK